MEKTLESALCGALIHLIAVAGVFIVVTLNLKGLLLHTSIDGYNVAISEWTSALYYVVKLHDLFMAASLSTIVSSVMRYELCMKTVCHTVLSSQDCKSVRQATFGLKRCAASSLPTRQSGM